MRGLPVHRIVDEQVRRGHSRGSSDLIEADSLIERLGNGHAHSMFQLARYV